MERLFIIIFLLSILPYMGIPNQYDMMIVVVLFVWLLYSVYLISKKHSQLHKSEMQERNSKTNSETTTESEEKENDTIQE